jgi:hypothetical protein
VLNAGMLRSQTFTISGNIRNTMGEPVEFATVQLLFENVYHQYTVSDSLGNYYLKATKTGDCELLVNILGYSAAQQKFALKNDTVINFVLQSNPLTINQAEVIGQKDLIQVKSDRLVVNITGNIETKGKETTDILKQLPTLNVTDEDVNIFGKSSAIVYINDRIVRLSGQSLLTYLNSLPPDIISSVEIITSPPAQYDAEGNTGIIKIVTKKNIFPGWKEYFRALYAQSSYPAILTSAYVNYTGKKFFFEGNISGAKDTYMSSANYYSYFPNEITTTHNPRRWQTIYSEAQTSFGYNFNKNSTLIVDFQVPLYDKQTMTDIDNTTSFINTANNQIDSTINSKGTMTTNNYTFNSEAFFKHLFSNSESYFTASVAYLNNYTKNSRGFSSFTQTGSTNSATENFYTEGNLNYNVFTHRLDFGFPLFGCTVNTGFKLSFVKTYSDNAFFNIINSDKILDMTMSNKYNYAENIQSVYYSMEKNIKNWSFKAGIRSEITQTTGNSLITNEVHKNNYADFFPSIYVSHQLNSKSNISVSYVERIERPPYKYLDPFRWYISKYDYGMGNPFLKPSYIKNFELMYRLNNFSIKMYYTRNDNEFGQYVVLDSLNMLNHVQKTDNFFDVNMYGIYVYKLLKMSKWLETALHGYFSYSDYQSNKKEFTSLSAISGTIIMNNTIFINKNFQFVCNANERIPSTYNYRKMHNYFKLDAGLNYTHSKNGFTASLLVTDIFKTANPEYSYVSGGIKQIYRNYNPTQVLRITLTWMLGNWYNRTQQISSPSNIEEKQRL